MEENSKQARRFLPGVYKNQMREGWQMLTSASDKCDLALERGGCQAERPRDGIVLPLLGGGGGRVLSNAALLVGLDGRDREVVGIFCPCGGHLEIFLSELRLYVCCKAVEEKRGDMNILINIKTGGDCAVRFER